MTVRSFGLVYLIDALLLAILTPAWLFAWSFFDVGGPTSPDPNTAFLYWGGMLIPLAGYVVALALARRRFGVAARLLAIVLSPIVVMPFLVMTLMDEYFVGLIVFLALAIPFGAVARTPAAWSGRHAQAD